MNNDLVYLAGPYSADPEYFFEVHVDYAAAIINTGRLVFSPIVHCHPLAEAHALPGDYQFWSTYNKHMLSLCSELWVIAEPGWKTSRGTQEEIFEAKQLDLPITLVQLNDHKLEVAFYAS